jgi:coenzyme Q-binding protein COQ10
MAAHKETRVLPYHPELIFDLVADVESYPEFLPMWQEVWVQSRTDEGYLTEQVIGGGPIRERFRTKTMLERPRRIEVNSLDGPFRNLSIRWEFQLIGKARCQVDFSLACQARSRLFQHVMEVMLLEMGRSTVSAFEQRARRLYDATPS